MASYDFNDADTQRNFDVIPDGTIATVRTTVRPGSAGEGGWLRRSKDGGSEALDCEFVVLDGPFAKRKVWSLFTVAGSTPGHAEAAKISAGKLRAMKLRPLRSPYDPMRRACFAASLVSSGLMPRPDSSAARSFPAEIFAASA